MVERRVCSELGIQADHVKSDKGRGTDGMKKMKKSNSIKLSDLEALQSQPPTRSVSRSRKLLPLHVPTTESLLRRSPNYMKPISSSDAKKEPVLVSLQNNQSGSDAKNLPQKCLSNSKSSSVSSKKTAKSMSRSSRVNLVRILTKTPNLKPSTTCPRKSTTLRADTNAPYRATCSSTLKDSKFPAHLMLNPGTSIMKICPYTYCSLNGNPHAPLPQFNCIMSAKNDLLKTRKSIKMEVPRRLKVPCETRKDFDIGQIVFDGKHACHEADKGNPIGIPLTREIGMDFFDEVDAMEREKAYEMGRSDIVKHLEDPEGVKFAMERNGNIADEKCVYHQVTPCLPCDDLTKSDMNPRLEFKNYFDTSEIEADTEESIHQEPKAKDTNKNHQPNWFHEEICTRIYCADVSSDGEQMENDELGDSDSQGNDMEWKEEQFCLVNHKKDIGSSVITCETDSKYKSFSESPHRDIFETSLDDILSNHYVDIMVEKSLQGNKEKSTSFDAQPRVQESTNRSIHSDYLSNNTDHEYDQSCLEEEKFQCLTNTEDNDRENEKHVENEAGCASMILNGDTIDNSDSHEICETYKIEEDREDSNTNLENKDTEIRQRNQIPSTDVPEEITIIVPDQLLLEEDQVTATMFQTKSCIGGEERNISKKWQWPTMNKRSIQDVEEMRKINPRNPNILPLVPDREPEKVELKHQMMDDRKNAEEWMLDFSLRKAITKLAPARKKKVALLVEAFETVMSTSKCETHTRNNSYFAHARTIQACI